jgi:hypothetical protein
LLPGRRRAFFAGRKERCAHSDAQQHIEKAMHKKGILVIKKMIWQATKVNNFRKQAGFCAEATQP